MASAAGLLHPRLADKERVAAALENPALRNLINNGIVRFSEVNWHNICDQSLAKAGQKNSALYLKWTPTRLHHDMASSRALK